MKTAKNPLWVFAITTLSLVALLTLATNSPFANSAQADCSFQGCNASPISLHQVIPR